MLPPSRLSLLALSFTSLLFAKASYLPALLRPGSLGVPSQELPARQESYPRVIGPHESGRDPERARKRTIAGSKEDGFLQLPLTRHHRVANSTETQGNGSSVATTTIKRRGPTRPRALAAAATQSVGGYPFGWAALNDFEGVSYLMEVQIGTPVQTVSLILDTGSYEMWVSPNCPASPDPTTCASFGQYSPANSSTSKQVSAPGAFNTNYGTGKALGQYWNDTLYVALEWVPSVQFAVASDSRDTWAGILGLGYGYPYTMSYPSLLQDMVKNKIIGAPIFSVGLGGEGYLFSEIIFGGINRWKFTGALEPVPIWPPIKEQNPSWIQYWINVTSVGMTTSANKQYLFTSAKNFQMPVIIDIGSTLSYVREDLVALIGQQFGATIDDQGNYIVDCKYMKQNGTIDFGFNNGNMVINVAYHDFFYEQYSGHCWLGVQPADAGSTNYVLGNTFIRGAYVVFDQEKDIVWLNQYYNCGDGVIVVGNSNDVKAARGVC